MAGLFDGFEGYRIPTEADKRHALTTALPPYVTPMLTSLYRDAGPLYAVRIPREVVGLLGQGPDAERT